MRLALVFPPSMPPTSPPCGIAYLKAFLGGKAFDVNLQYHDTAAEMVYKGDLPCTGDGREPEQLKAAITFFKGNNLYNQEEYNESISTFFDFFTEIDEYMQKECMKYLEDSAEDVMLDLLDRLLAPVHQYHPDVVGISQMVLPQREFVFGLAKHLNQEEIPLVLGGASLSYNPEAYLSTVGATDLSKVFDAVFYGEGELPLKAYTEGKPLEKICNIVYKRDKIIKNKETAIKDLNRLPPPNFEDFPLDQYYTPEVVLPLLTSRGCYWRRCTFCTHYRSYYVYRACSVKKVLSDLKELQQKYKTSYFLFADEMIHPHRFNEIADSIKKEGLNIRFYSEAKPTRKFTKELLQNMFDAGARALLWGVESGTQRILDLLEKGTNVPDIEHVLKTSHKAGIWNMVFMIIQSPTQTKEEIEKDILFLQKNAPYISTVTGSSFKLEVGSRMYENPEQFGIQVEEHDSVFTPVRFYKDSGGLTPEESDFLYKKYNVEFIVLSKVSWYFGKMRDHMLLFADHLSKTPLKK